MAFHPCRATVLVACIAMPGLLASCAIADGPESDDRDERAERADPVQVHPASVVFANQCGVRYSISQSTSILFVSQSGLRADVSATARSSGVRERDVEEPDAVPERRSVHGNGVQHDVRQPCGRHQLQDPAIDDISRVHDEKLITRQERGSGR
jgi:hypothetical protein